MNMESIFGEEFIKEEWEVIYYEYASYDGSSKKTTSWFRKNN
jgi:hypothetical protein